jgi:superfamily II RNA helicase
LFSHGAKVQSFQIFGKSFFYFHCTLADQLYSKMTDVYEGSLIRIFRRLEELLRQMAQGAKVMGNGDLEEKFQAALTTVKRDVVAAGSLYL